MKQFTILLSAIFLLSSFQAFSGGKKGSEGFSGTIKYKVSYEGREITPTEQSQLPSEKIDYFLGSMMRMDIVTPMYSFLTIINNESLETTILFDMMGQKMYVKKSGEEVKAAKDSLKDEKPNIKLIDETKTIAGYACKKAEIEKDGAITTVYYTEEIKANSEEYKDLPGFPLYISQKLPQDEELVMVYQATEVSVKKPKKGIFEIPAGYEEMSDEMKKQIGM
ncbi:MAG: hypothetical protein JXR60_00915 [Bacteroidales bacterium]|nr:hypothetical protein [Bacteroidales bacterium]